ncbi:hypothetical protein [Prosthecobacter sp.]|uniref:hypothetical protein n=1 Tax=Prosthecobacter sp. TaxID=1965333 RepID=UPI002488EADE|nr:hypothetical protein [Prosthecobacter sp.]MDI1314261.1 hypothetical protein [Prosthecobacter sp.]
MNLMQFPLRLQSGRIVLLRLEQLPAAQRARNTCPAGSADSGWRIQVEPCEISPALHHLTAAWQRLSCATHTARTLADLTLIHHALPADGAFLVSPLPSHWYGRDVRPWLGDPSTRLHLMNVLAPHRREAFQLLGKDLPHAHDEHTSASASHLWRPWLRPRRQDWNAELEAATAMINRGCEADREALIATLLHEGGTAWLLLLARQPTHEHLPLLRALVETKQHLRPPPAGMHKLLTTVHHLTKSTLYSHTAKTCLLSLANGCTPRFIAHALHFHQRWKLEFQTQARPEHEPRQRQLHLVLHGKAANWLRNPKQIWEQATGLKDWTSAIQRLLARSVGKEMLDSILEALRHLGRKRGLDACKWTHWLARWDEMLREVHATPRAKRKLSADLIEAWRINPEHASMSAHSVDHLLRWLQRAREFEKHPGEDIPVMIEALWENLSTDDETTLLQIPEKTWRQMQPALAGWSARTNAIYGLSYSWRLPAGCLLGMLMASPLEWTRTMRRIGELEWRERKELWAAFCEHPLTTCDASSTPLQHVIVMVETIHASHPRFPGVPDKLRSAGTLHEHVKTHYMDELLRNIHRLRLAVLDELAEWALRRRFPSLGGDNIATHTLRVAAAAGEENRRSFRRLLNACDQEQATREWTLSHPANQQWLRKQPRQRAEQWTGGFFIEHDIRDIGPVRIGPEDDLQAILRMGTDFGTCLSAGSFNSFSTAANALDANKRVLYARDVKDRVWARQLVAISDSGHLVCFPVYARRSHAALRHLFAAYDHTLAQALRLPMWLSREDTAPIAKIVCKEWYDDGIWRP